jgi:hypothetical protein
MTATDEPSGAAAMTDSAAGPAGAPESGAFTAADYPAQDAYPEPGTQRAPTPAEAAGPRAPIQPQSGLVPGLADTSVLTVPPGPGVALLGLEASNVSAWFSGHKVLDRVSCTCRPAGSPR